MASRGAGSSGNSICGMRSWRAWRTMNEWGASRPEVRHALRVVQIAADGGFGLQRSPLRVEPNGGHDTACRQFPVLRFGAEAARNLTQTRIVSANHDMGQVRVALREHPPCRLGSGQVQFARALHLLGIELAGVADNLGGRPRA